MKKFEKDTKPIKDQEIEEKSSLFNPLDKPQQTTHDTETDPLSSAKETLKQKEPVSGQEKFAILSDIANRSIRGEIITSTDSYLIRNQANTKISKESQHEKFLLRNLKTAMDISLPTKQNHALRDIKPDHQKTTKTSLKKQKRERIAP